MAMLWPDTVERRPPGEGNGALSLQQGGASDTVSITVAPPAGATLYNAERLAADIAERGVGVVLYGLAAEARLHDRAGWPGVATATIGDVAQIDFTPLTGADHVVIKPTTDDEAGWLDKVLCKLNDVGARVEVAEVLDMTEPTPEPIPITPVVIDQGLVDHATRKEIWRRGKLAADEQEEANARRLRLTPASAIKPRPVRWTWTGRIPAGELTLTPGRGGIGKSTFHVWTIAHLTRGTLPGVRLGMPGRCIIAASEDSWDRTIVPRLMAADADMDLVFRVDVVTETDSEVSISLPRDVDKLAGEIARVGAVLLSVDPVMSVISNGLDSHKDADVRQALTPLARLADRTGCAVLGNAHFNKSSGSDPLSLVMGSAAFGNVARAALGFARDTEAEDGSCVISQVKNNLGRLDLPSLRYRIDTAWIDTDEGQAEVGRLVMLGESDRSVADILGDRGSDDDRSDASEAAEWIKAFLEDLPTFTAPAAEVLHAGVTAGFAKRTLQRARKRAGVSTCKTGLAGGWSWTLDPRRRHEDAEDAYSRETAPTAPSVASSAHLSDDLRNRPGRCATCGWHIGTQGHADHCGEVA